MNVTADLDVGRQVSCTYVHLLTEHDVHDLERKAVVVAMARDKYGFQVEVIANETVSLSQVTRLSQD